MARVGTSQVHSTICPCILCLIESCCIRNCEPSMGLASAFAMVINDATLRRSEHTTALYATVRKVSVHTTTRAPSMSITKARAMHVPASLDAFITRDHTPKQKHNHKQDKHLESSVVQCRETLVVCARCNFSRACLNWVLES